MFTTFIALCALSQIIFAQNAQITTAGGNVNIVVNASKENGLAAQGLLATFANMRSNLAALNSTTSSQIVTGASLATQIGALTASLSSASASQLASTAAVAATVASVATTQATQLATQAQVNSQVGSTATLQSSSLSSLGSQLASTSIAQLSSALSLSTLIASNGNLLSTTRQDLSGAAFSLASQSLSSSVGQGQLSGAAFSIAQVQASLSSVVSTLASNAAATSSALATVTNTVSTQGSYAVSLSSALITTASGLSGQIASGASTQAVQSSALAQLGSQLSSLNASHWLTLNSLSASITANANAQQLLSAQVVAQAQSAASILNQQQNSSATLTTLIATQASSLAALSTQVVAQSNSLTNLSSQFSSSSVTIASMSSALQATSSTLTSLLLKGSPYRDCSYVRSVVYNGTSTPPNAIYTFPNGNLYYCDFTALSGSWTLMATFEQPLGLTVQSMPISMYNAYFNSMPTWTQGNSEARPVSPEPIGDGSFHIRSLNWDSVLVAGKSYLLRQRFFKGSGLTKFAIFDVVYTFTYNGVVVRDLTATTANRAWVLTSRTVIQDTTGITWNTPVEAVYFWPPFTSAVTGAVYSACGSYELSTSGCGATTAGSRRYGDAGIIGSSQDSNDPASSWAPHTNIGSTYDIVFVHQAAAVYGSRTGTLDPIFLSYWVSAL